MIPSSSPHGIVPATPWREGVCLWHYQKAKSASLEPLGNSNMAVLGKHLEITLPHLLQDLT